MARTGWTEGSYSATTYCGFALSLSGNTWVKGSRYLNVQYADGGVTAGTSATLTYCAPDIGP